ncbi:MAG: flagellar hook-length control protein FliK [Lachnospiraceae bacterium]|nr:flagellar hook-length control protein FliK [Lachnospiraceae bacterium]
MSLSSFFHLTGQTTNQTNTNSTNQTSQTSSAEGTSHYHGSNAVRNLAAGQTISGEVVAVRDGEIDIAIDKDAYLTAKLDRDMNLMVGQTLTFEVKSTGGNRIALSPLYENMAQNPTISNAIQAAHIPLNNTSASMVNDMMKNGMPIDKDSLQNMYRQVVNNPEASGETIVQMNRLQIPVTPENIAEFGIYKNYEHSIMEAAGTIAEDLANAFQEILQNGTPSETADFLQKVLQIFGQTGEENSGTGILNENGLGNSEETANILENISVPSGETTEAKGDQKAQIAVETQVQGAEEQQEPGKMRPELNENRAEKAPIESNTAQSGTVVVENNEQNQGVHPFSSQLGLSRGAAANLGVMLQQLGVSPELVQAIKNGSAISETVLQNILELVKQSGKDKRGLNGLLNSREFTSLLKGQVEKQWMIQPEDVAREGKVEELYKRIQQQTAKLADSISGLVKENSALGKSVSSLSANVEFMNQLNQVFTYVQLPLKMSGGKAHGDLYVYTNKKNLAKKDGNVSALLHLDMEHLGAMDIYVQMQNQKVSTKFYLEKEAYIDFIAEHIHILDERLQKRGYTMQAEFIQKEGTTNVLDEMIQQENKSNGMVISKYAFDARA